MPDPHEIKHGTVSEMDIVRGLRALPSIEPPGDGWPGLRAALQQRASPIPARSVTTTRRRVRAARAWPFAAAAALLLFVAWPHRPGDGDGGPEPAVPASAGVALGEPGNGDGRRPGADDGAADLRRLIAQSQWLERLIEAEAIVPAAQDADQMIIGQALRSRIELIDAAMAVTVEPEPGLWAARVGALTQLAELSWASREVAWSDAGLATPDAAVLWSN